MNAFWNWLDNRTGFRAIAHEALYENVPSGARFRYVTGSMLVFAFFAQAVTGVFLWLAYSPSSQTAYESVWWIQYQMSGGWLVRGLHHFMAQAMVVVMGLHLLQVVWDGAYRRPREFNHWIGLILMLIVMGLGLTGYLLPWDQKGYWATNVATNLATLAPVAGKETQLIAVGGTDYGHHTLTRFFALHAGILPALLVAFLALHIAAFRRHGLTAYLTPGRPDDTFWPKQVLYDAIACFVLILVVLMCTVHFDIGGVLRGNLPVAHRGAELGAPADPSQAYSAARPEWYFLFLFQLLKYFPGSSEVIGAIVIPGVVMLFLFAMPLIGWTYAGHMFNRVIMVSLLLAALVLTGLAYREDYFSVIVDALKYDDSQREQYKKQIDASRDFLAARVSAEHEAERMNELINRRVVKSDGSLSDPLFIQRQGAVYLLRNDPLTQGPRLFAQKCASCHDYRPPANADVHVAANLQNPKPVAPNLYGFASRPWIAGLLDKDRIRSPAYFGGSKHSTGAMVEWVSENDELLQGPDRDAIIAALSAQAKLHSQREVDQRDVAIITKGVGVIQKNCTECHRLGAEGDLGTAPDLTGYGSYEWMLGFLSDPSHSRFYGEENDAMPSFAQDLDSPATHKLSVRELSLIVDWLRGDYYRSSDSIPVLPHHEELARETVRWSRQLTAPPLKVIGLEPKK